MFQQAQHLLSENSEVIGRRLYGFTHVFIEQLQGLRIFKNSL